MMMTRERGELPVMMIGLLDGVSSELTEPRQALRLLLMCVMLCASSAYLISAPPLACAERWRHNASESEVSALIREVLTRAELPSQQIRRGAYPLLGESYGSDATLPLLSFPCPLLLSCDLLIKRLQSQLLTRGYRLVYSDQSPIGGRPMHFAVARGKHPVMAIRLHPSATSVTLVLHLTPTISVYRASLAQLSPHVTFTFTPELLRSRPETLRELVESGREHLLRIDDVMIKRALLDQESGAPITDSARRRAQFGAQLDALFHYVPSTFGVYLDRDASLTLDRALADELIERCAAQRRVIVTAGSPDQLLSALATARGVRSLELSEMNEQLTDMGALEERLKGVSATLVVQGEVALELNIGSAQALRSLSVWSEQLMDRDVVMLRVSERAL